LLINLPCLITYFLYVPDWKNYNDHVYSFSRDWRLLVSWEPNWGLPESPRTSQHYSMEGFQWVTLILGPIMSIDWSLSASRGNFFQFGWYEFGWFSSICQRVWKWVVRILYWKILNKMCSFFVSFCLLNGKNNFWTNVNFFWTC